MPETPDRINVAIVGGGIGGLSAAIGLLKYPHIDVQIYEAAPKFNEIGAGVAFGPNASRALELIGRGTEQAFRKVATSNLYEKHANTWFEINYGEGPHAGEFISAPTNTTGQKSLHRAHFLNELIKFVPEHISQFGKRLVSIEEPDDDAPLTLRFKDGITATADCILGFDGIRSAVRHHLFGNQYDPVFSGSVAWRGIVPMAKARERLGDEKAGNSFVYTGNNSLLMHYPIDGGETINIVAMNTSKRSWNEDSWVVPANFAELDETFKNYEDRSRRVIDLLLDMPTTQAWALWDLPPLQSYTSPGSRIVLLGDSSHATTPFQGNGAGTAIEDAYVISEVLGHVSSRGQIPAAFEAYDAICRPRSLKNVATSRAAGELYSLRAKGIGDDPAKLKAALDSRMDWIWDKDIELEGKEALQTLERLLALRD